MNAVLREKLLVSPDQLSAELNTDTPPAVLDVRFVPLQPGQIEDYRKGHIPGAIFVDLPKELAGGTGPGAYPLPRLEDLQKSVRAWGVELETPVVVYDDFLGGGAARAWWTLTWAGLKNVRILDGGLAAWREIGGEVSTSVVAKPRESTVILEPGQLRELSIEDAANFAEIGVLIDSRPEQAFVRTQGDDSANQGGHIPGATNVPFSELFTEDGSYKSTDELIEVLDLVVQRAHPEIGGDAPIASYCGGGILATQLAFVQRLTGRSLEAPVFIGSWSAWIEEPTRPIE